MKYITLCFLMFSLVCKAQPGKINPDIKFKITGKCIITDSKGEDSTSIGIYEGLKVILSTDSSEIEVISNKKLFEFNLLYNKVYTVTITKDGYKSRKIRYKTTDISVSRWNDGFESFPIIIKLFPKEKDKTKVLEQPLGAIYYDSSIDEFTYSANEK